MRRAVLVVALLALLVGPMAAGAQQSSEITVEGSTFLVQLQADGDARWRVTTTYALDSESERDAFERYATAFRSGESVPAPDPTFFRTAAERASEAAGRPMEIENVSRSTSMRGEIGKLVLRFTWTNFLERDGDTLVLHDALATPNNGTWLQSLTARQTLVIRTPPGYVINYTSVPFLQQNRAFVVEQPRTFEQPFTVRYGQDSVTTGPTTGSPGSETPSTADPPWPLLVGGMVVIGVSLASLLAWRRRTEPAPPERPSEGSREPSTTGDSGAGEAEAEGGTGETPDAGEEPESAEATAEDLELLSDEERVERLLEREGGRMRQADIVTETDWSDAKVSQLLSRMADEGRIEKLRIGRENLISLPEYESDEE